MYRAATATHRAHRTAEEALREGAWGERLCCGACRAWKSAALRGAMHGCVATSTHLDQGRPLAIVLGIKVVGRCNTKAARNGQ